MKPFGNPAVAQPTKSLRATWLALCAQFSARWQTLAARERTGLTAAAALVAVLLIWSIAVRPAWRTLSVAPAQIEQLDLQLQTMRRLAGEATELRNMTPISAAQSGAALLAATERLGSRAQLIMQGDRATVTFNAMSGGELQNWLVEVRSAARARVTEARLSRDSRGYAGTVVLSLRADS